MKWADAPDSCHGCGTTERKLYHVTDDIYYCAPCRPWLAERREAEPQVCTDCGGPFGGMKWLFKDATLCSDCRAARKAVDGSMAALDQLDNEVNRS
jgi:hypothetical protein